MSVKPIPEGYHSVTPYLVVADPARLIQFLKAAFGAVEREKLQTPGGTIMHAEVCIGDSIVMMGSARGERKPMPGMLYVYVPDCDDVYRSAIAAGAESVREPSDQFYGDRVGGVRDPLGNEWWMATHKEDVSVEEMSRRHEKAFGEKSQAPSADAKAQT